MTVAVSQNDGMSADAVTVPITVTITNQTSGILVKRFVGERDVFDFEMQDSTGKRPHESVFGRERHGREVGADGSRIYTRQRGHVFFVAPGRTVAVGYNLGKELDLAGLKTLSLKACLRGASLVGPIAKFDKASEVAQIIT